MENETAKKIKINNMLGINGIGIIIVYVVVFTVLSILSRHFLRPCGDNFGIPQRGRYPRGG
jgi:hypothetical protein